MVMGFIGDDGKVKTVGTANPLPTTGGDGVGGGGLTDEELRASAVPVSMAAVPTGGATSAKQDVTHADLAAILAKQIATPATEAKQDTALTDLGGVTETAPASDTASSGLNGRLQRIAQRLTALIALLPTSLGQKAKAGSFAVTLASDQDALVVVGSDNAPIVGTFQRPNDTSGYAANDVVSNNATTTTLTTLTNMARVAGGGGYIAGARLSMDDKSKTPRFRVHLFNANNPTVAADNAQHKSVHADESKRVATFDLPAMTTAADTTNSDRSAAADWTLRIKFTCAAGSRDLYYFLECLDAYTPAAQRNFSLTLVTDPN